MVSREVGQILDNHKYVMAEDLTLYYLCLICAGSFFTIGS